MILIRILKNCKINKFHEINFKILARILVMPKMLSSIKGKDNLQWCAWCGKLGSLEHVLLWYPEIEKVHKWVIKMYKTKYFKPKHWIFGQKILDWNQLIWVCNFTLYQCHLLACEGHLVDVLSQLENEFL